MILHTQKNNKKKNCWSWTCWTFFYASREGSVRVIVGGEYGERWRKGFFQSHSNFRSKTTLQSVCYHHHLFLFIDREYSNFPFIFSFTISVSVFPRLHLLPPFSNLLLKNSKFLHKPALLSPMVISFIIITNFQFFIWLFLNGLCSREIDFYDFGDFLVLSVTWITKNSWLFESPCVVLSCYW